MVPRNLRVRMVMTENVQLIADARLARGKGRTIRGAKIHSSTASMTDIPAQQTPPRAIRWWLVSIAALIAIMVLVGGAQRLTESGLSIVEWKPVTGTLPPLNQEQWTQAFDAYKTIPQYRELNAGMNLAEFKTIFWLSLIHISEPTRLGMISYAVFCLK